MHRGREREKELSWQEKSGWLVEANRLRDTKSNKSLCGARTKRTKIRQKLFVSFFTPSERSSRFLCERAPCSCLHLVLWWCSSRSECEQHPIKQKIAFFFSSSSLCCFDCPWFWMPWHRCRHGIWLSRCPFFFSLFLSPLLLFMSKNMKVWAHNIRNAFVFMIRTIGPCHIYTLNALRILTIFTQSITPFMLWKVRWMFAVARIVARVFFFCSCCCSFAK